MKRKKTVYEPMVWHGGLTHVRWRPKQIEDENRERKQNKKNPEDVIKGKCQTCGIVRPVAQLFHFVEVPNEHPHLFGNHTSTPTQKDVYVCKHLPCIRTRFPSWPKNLIKDELSAEWDNPGKKKSP